MLQLKSGRASALAACSYCLDGNGPRKADRPTYLPCRHSICGGCAEGLLAAPGARVRGFGCPTCKRPGILAKDLVEIVAPIGTGEAAAAAAAAPAAAVAGAAAVAATDAPDLGMEVDLTEDGAAPHLANSAAIAGLLFAPVPRDGGEDNLDEDSLPEDSAAGSFSSSSSPAPSSSVTPPSLPSFAMSGNVDSECDLSLKMSTLSALCKLPLPRGASLDVSAASDALSWPLLPFKLLAHVSSASREPAPKLAVAVAEVRRILAANIEAKICIFSTFAGVLDEVILSLDCYFLYLLHGSYFFSKVVSPYRFRSRSFWTRFRTTLSSTTTGMSGCFLGSG